MEKAAAENGLDVGSPKIDFQIGAYAHCEVWATYRWLRRDAEQRPEDMAMFVESCVSEDLNKALDRRK